MVSFVHMRMQKTKVTSIVFLLESRPAGARKVSRQSVPKRIATRRVQAFAFVYARLTQSMNMLDELFAKSFVLQDVRIFVHRRSLDGHERTTLFNTPPFARLQIE
jgi:hypothetical protein